MDEEFALKLLPIFQTLRVYHRYKVNGLKNIPRQGPAIIACNHSLATYDIGLLMADVFEHRGRLPRSLIDRLFFKIPGLGHLMERTGCVLGTLENAKALLDNGEVIYVAPGGMRESLRPMTERYQVLWENRKGFVKLSILSGAPIILAACPKADDIYDVYPNALSSWFYKNLKVPVFLARGLGLSPLPKPVGLRHFLSEPIPPPPMPENEQDFDALVDEHHKKVVKRMRQLIAEAIAFRPKSHALLS